MGKCIFLFVLLTATPAFAGLFDGQPKTYRSANGAIVQAPNRPGLSFGGAIRCRDGSQSHAVHQSGACSHHGGMAR